MRVCRCTPPLPSLALLAFALLVPFAATNALVWSFFNFFAGGFVPLIVGGAFAFFAGGGCFAFLALDFGLCCPGRSLNLGAATGSAVLGRSWPCSESTRIHDCMRATICNFSDALYLAHCVGSNSSYNSFAGVVGAPHLQNVHVT